MIHFVEGTMKLVLIHNKNDIIINYNLLRVIFPTLHKFTNPFRI